MASFLSLHLHIALFTALPNDAGTAWHRGWHVWDRLLSFGHCEQRNQLRPGGERSQNEQDRLDVCDKLVSLGEIVALALTMPLVAATCSGMGMGSASRCGSERHHARRSREIEFTFSSTDAVNDDCVLSRAVQETGLTPSLGIRRPHRFPARSTLP